MSGPKPETLYAQLVSKAVLNSDEAELYELTQLAGLTIDPEIFKILLDLLKLNVPPLAIVQSVRSMCSSHPKYPDDENKPPQKEDLYTGSYQARTKSAEPGQHTESYTGRSMSSERLRKTQNVDAMRSIYSHTSSKSGSTRPHSFAADSSSDKRGATQSREGYGSRSSSQLSSGYRDTDKGSKKRSSYKT